MLQHTFYLSLYLISIIASVISTVTLISVPSVVITDRLTRSSPQYKRNKNNNNQMLLLFNPCVRFPKYIFKLHKFIKRMNIIN